MEEISDVSYKIKKYDNKAKYKIEEKSGRRIKKYLIIGPEIYNIQWNSFFRSIIFGLILNVFLQQTIEFCNLLIYLYVQL